MVAFNFSTAICKSGSKRFVATWVGTDYQHPDAVTAVEETNGYNYTSFQLTISITFFNKQGLRIQQFRNAHVSKNNKMYFALDGDVAPYTFALSAVNNAGEKYSLIDGAVSLCDEDGGGGPKSDDGTGEDDGNEEGRGGKGGDIGDLPTGPRLPEKPCLPAQPTATQSTPIDTPCSQGSGTAGPKGFSGS